MSPRRRPRQPRMSPAARGAALDRKLIQAALNAPLRTAALAWWDQQLVTTYRDMLLDKVAAFAPSRASELHRILDAADHGTRHARHGWVHGEQAIRALTENPTAKKPASTRPNTATA